MVTMQILGTGCPKCTKLMEVAKAAAEALGLEYQLEKISDINKIMSFGVMMTPGLVVNGKVLMVGKVPGLEEMKTVLQKEIHHG